MTKKKQTDRTNAKAKVVENKSKSGRLGGVLGKLKDSWQVRLDNYWGKIPVLKKVPGVYRKWLVLGLAGFAFLFWFILKDLPSPTKLSSYAYPVSTKILDRNGELIYEIYADERRTPVSLTELPEYVKQATIAIEDKDFYKHHGFDIRGIARAVYKILFKSKLEGGSTITQQLVKNALLSPERTVQRKIREFILTWVVEVIYPKDKILEMYFNQVPYGGTAWGIEAAAETYFGKRTKDLSLAEAALLAGLPASPTSYSPFGAHPELAKERQSLVLAQMVEAGYITAEEAEAAKNQELKFKEPEKLAGLHFSLWVKDQLVGKFGERQVEQGGLRVYTTLDLNLQRWAEVVVATEVASLKKAIVGNGAVLVTNPGTGEILAMVGSKDYWATDEDGKVNIVFALRQPGSAIKPLNYALAIRDKKINAATSLIDVPTCFVVAGQEDYCPENYDMSYHGVVQARFALGNSYNLPAVKVLALNGLEHFIDFAKEMGITTFSDPKNYGLSLTLGGGEVRMADMAVAFGVLANGGAKKNLTAIKKIEDYQGKVLLEEKEKEGPRVLPMDTAYIVSHILLDNNARSAMFGTSSYLVVKGHPEISVKTGTTNDKRDNWTIGYNRDILVVTWVGNNDNEPMGAVASGVTGASPIWNKIITKALENKEQAWPMKPAEVVGATVCALSGLLPTGSGDQAGCQTRFEFFTEGGVPQQPESLRQVVQIDRTTGQLASSKTLVENMELSERSIIADPLGAMFCLDCTLQTEPQVIRYPIKGVSNEVPKTGE